MMSEKLIEDCWNVGNVDGERDSSDAWTASTRVTLLNEKPLDGYTWSRRRQVTNDFKTRQYVARDVEAYV